jgi:carboxymethylenebutenolidase
MCVEDGSRPPLPPIRGSALDVRDLVLTASDEATFAAVLARAGAPAAAGAPPAAGVVILPDWRGLHPFYEELALRFAEAGVHAVAIDPYGRTAGAAKRPPDFVFEEHFLQLNAAALTADVASAVALLRSAEGGAAARVYTLGFCVGGRASFLQAAEGHELAGAIGFYGWPVGEHRSGLPAPIDRTDRFSCPVLAIFAGADYGISDGDAAIFDAALTRDGVSHETVTYPGAPHGFFDKSNEDFADASADAWRRVLAFMRA